MAVPAEIPRDGIMSAITVNVARERGETDAGLRVRIALAGTFLPDRRQG